MSNRGVFASAAVFVFYVGPGFTLQIDSTVVSILTNTVFVNSTNITTNIETAELSLRRRLPSRSFADRLATGGEFRGGMLHCCSHMLSGGGENSIAFTFSHCQAQVLGIRIDF